MIGIVRLVIETGTGIETTTTTTTMTGAIIVARKRRRRRFYVGRGNCNVATGIFV